MKKMIISVGIPMLTCIIAIADTFIFDSKYYNIVLILCLISAFIPMIKYRKKYNNSVELKLTTLMTLISAIVITACSGFSLFKPVTCVTVLTGCLLGIPSGYFCGIVSVLISSLFIGIGEWTVFQVLSLGIIGLVSGTLGKYISNKNIFVLILTLLSGITFACSDVFRSICDVDGMFAFGLFIPTVLSSLKWFCIYGVIDAVTVCILIIFIGKRLLRIKKRFGAFE